MERRIGWSQQVAEDDEQQNLFGTRVRQMAEIAKAERELRQQWLESVQHLLSGKAALARKRRVETGDDPQ